MNTTQILCFLAAARCQSFTKAANELYISQPAFSRNIAMLEKEWGVELFDRNNKRTNTRLTAAGKAMFDSMTNLSAQYKAAIHNSQSIQKGEIGALRIGFISGNRIDDQALDAIDRFQEKFPGVELLCRRGNHSELFRWLSENAIDLAFCLKIDVEDKQWIVYEALYSVESVLILPVRHPIFKKENPKLIDFEDDTFLNLSSAESPAINTLLLRECAKAGFVPKVFDVANISEQILYLEAGKGVAIGSINNTAAFSSNISMLRLPDLKPQQMVLARNRDNKNPCILMFRSCYDPIE
ncbi:MAG: LysR family transcriptional regulator [Clostridiales bacterium]|nr:LysR family transcriptional regulator [Clostridiales bacterium]